MDHEAAKRLISDKCCHFFMVGCKHKVWWPFEGHWGAIESAAVFKQESLNSRHCTAPPVAMVKCHSRMPWSIIRRFQALHHHPSLLLAPPLQWLPQQQVISLRVKSLANIGVWCRVPTVPGQVICRQMVGWLVVMCVIRREGAWVLWLVRRVSLRDAVIGWRMWLDVWAEIRFCFVLFLLHLIGQLCAQ